MKKIAKLAQSKIKKRGAIPASLLLDLEDSGNFKTAVVVDQLRLDQLSVFQCIQDLVRKA